MYRMTTTYEIWDEEDGSHVEVGEAASGADEVEIRQYDETGEELGSVTFIPEQGELVANAIHRYLKAREFLQKNPSGAVPKPPEEPPQDEKSVDSGSSPA